VLLAQPSSIPHCRSNLLIRSDPDILDKDEVRR